MFHAISRSAILTLLLAACVTSVEPVISESESVFEPALVGTWVTLRDTLDDGSIIVRGRETAVITHDADEYHITHTDTDGEIAEYDARLGYLGDRLVLQISPAHLEQDLPSGYQSMTVAGHALFFIDLRADTLRASVLDADSVLQALEDGRLDLSYLVTEEHGPGDDILLTSPTEQLISALTEYVKRSGVIGEAGHWRRAE